MSLLFIVNRKSRRASEELASCLSFLQEREKELIVIDQQDPKAITAAIAEYQQKVERVIIGGGDGTLNAAAGALRQTGLPLAILPLGTANDLARTLGIPDEPLEACELALNGKVEQIDLGEVNGHNFFNAAHLGLGAEVNQSLDGESKKRLGAVSYAKAAFDAYRHTRPFKVKLTVDGKKRVLHAIHVGVGNGCFYGGGNLIAKDARIDDGWLDCYVIKPTSMFGLVSLAPAIRSGEQLDESEMVRFRCRELTVTVKQSKTIFCDGEPLTRTPATFKVIEKAVRVIVPDRGPNNNEVETA